MKNTIDEIFDWLHDLSADVARIEELLKLNPRKKDEDDEE